MAYSVRILSTAERELDEIVSYLAGYSKAAARGFLNEYENVLDLLSAGILELRLSRLPELAELGYRSALVDNYVFLYYIEDECLVIAHFFHQRQDYAPLVLGEAVAGDAR